MARFTALVLLVVGLLAACSGTGPDPEPQRTSGPPRAGSPTGPAQAGAGEPCVPEPSARSRSRDDLVGRSEDAVAKAEKAAGHEVRVLGVDGKCNDRDDDLRPKRVNLVIRDGKVVWASMF
ncbi:hypothetical protein AB0M95_24575 [Sphaerisporangium sp. NPDC051017]|uniref:hypothetical protein n=1 Tax=Sphaerisporangium sp. NPDC051017 TaxID=3154636 RepID=UPI00341B0E94